jgi:hypothetical protein
MYQIQTNLSGTRHINVDEEHLATIEKYALFHGLVASSGIVEEKTLEKLRQNVRSYLCGNPGSDDLARLCQDVLFHDNMKTYGLRELIMLYVGWMESRYETEPTASHEATDRENQA